MVVVAQTVLEYFLLSSFADSRCLNIIARDRGLTEHELAQIAPSIFYSLAWGSDSTVAYYTLARDSR